MSLEIRLRQALGDRRIAAYSVEELLPAVNTVLLQAYVLVGFTPPKSADVALLTSKLAADLQESYPFLTLRELSLCFELGAKGEYGDFMGLNLRTFTRWLKTYQTSELRYRAVVERERQVLVKQQAMAILLKRFFDRLIAEEGELFGQMAA